MLTCFDPLSSPFCQPRSQRFSLPKPISEGTSAIRVTVARVGIQNRTQKRDSACYPFSLKHPCDLSQEFKLFRVEGLVSGTCSLKLCVFTVLGTSSLCEYIKESSLRSYLKLSTPYQHFVF